MEREEKLYKLAERKSALKEQLAEVDREFQLIAKELYGHFDLLARESGYFELRYDCDAKKIELDENKEDVVFIVQDYENEVEFRLPFSHADIEPEVYKKNLAYKRKVEQQQKKREKAKLKRQIEKQKEAGERRLFEQLKEKYEKENKNVNK